VCVGDERLVERSDGKAMTSLCRTMQGLACLSILSFATAMALLGAWSRPAWSLDEPGDGCAHSNSTFLTDLPSAGNETPLAASDSAGLTSVRCQPAPLFVPAGLDGQAPGGQTSGTNPSQSSSAKNQGQATEVNPVTGLAVASPTNYTPLTGSERWELYWKMTYASPGPYFSPLVNAALLDQDNGTPRQWGGGFPGFGRRLASRAGNAILQGTFQAPFAAILHEDVRYIPTSRRSFQRRALHAVLYSFLTYNDAGHPTLNVANLTAFYAATAVTTTWLPDIRNAAKYTLSNGTEQIALSFPLNVVQEFWPEIRHHLFRRH